MSECIKMKSDKYSLRNSPPYPANKCKTMKKKGNDGNYYLSEPDKNGIYKWVKVNKNKTIKNKATKKDLQILVKKYKVTKSGTNKEVAERLVRLQAPFIKNKRDKQIIEQFLTKSAVVKKWGFEPAKWGFEPAKI